MSNDNPVLHEFQKNASEVVRASVGEYNGKDYLHLRIWFKDLADPGGEFHPTKKGLTLSVDLIDDLSEAVEKLKEKLRR